MGRGAKVDTQASLDIAEETTPVPAPSTKRRRGVRAEPKAEETAVETAVETTVETTAVETPVETTAVETAVETVAETVEAPEPEPVIEPRPKPVQRSEPVEPVAMAIETPAASAVFDRDELARIICVPKSKRQVPTLVKYRADGEVPVRWVLVDIGEPILRAGWDYYRGVTVKPSAEEYMRLVYEITRMRLPRMYRVLAELDLAK